MATSDVIGMKKPGGSFFSQQSAAETFRPIIFESVAAMRVKKFLTLQLSTGGSKRKSCFAGIAIFKMGQKIEWVIFCCDETWDWKL